MEGGIFVALELAVGFCTSLEDVIVGMVLEGRESVESAADDVSEVVLTVVVTVSSI